jgi:hypothetical protein
VDEGERLSFMRAVAEIQEYFARNDEQLYTSIRVNWDRLKQAPTFISECLSVEVAIPGLDQIRSDIRAHVVTSPLTFYFKCHADVGEKNAGGRVVAECFSPETCREQVALAWVWAWQEAIKGGSQELALAEEREEEVQDEIVEAVKKSKGQKSSYERGDTKKNEAAPGKESVALPRKLKDFEQLTTTNIIAITSNAAEGGYKPPTGRGLKKDAPLAPAASEPTSRLSSSCQGPITYTKEQLEEKALQCLHHVLRYGNLGELKDFRKFRGIGADAAIELKKFFEIKASGREMPDRVELTLNELERAKLSSDSFYLVVVSGLEEGYDTILHIYKNPLRTLVWSPSRSIIVSGLKSKQAVQVYLDVDSPPAK